MFNFLSIFNLKQFLFNISYLGELLFSWIYRKKYQRKKFINQINRRHIGFLGRCMNSIHKSYNMYLTLPTLKMIPNFVLTNYCKVNFIFLWWLVRLNFKERIKIIHQANGRHIDFLSSGVFPGRCVLVLRWSNKQ